MQIKFKSKKVNAHIFVVSGKGTAFLALAAFELLNILNMNCSTKEAPQCRKLINVQQTDSKCNTNNSAKLDTTTINDCNVDNPTNPNRKKRGK